MAGTDKLGTPGIPQLPRGTATPPPKAPVTAPPKLPSATPTAKLDQNAVSDNAKNSLKDPLATEQAQTKTDPGALGAAMAARFGKAATPEEARKTADEALKAEPWMEPDPSLTVVSDLRDSQERTDEGDADATAALEANADIEKTALDALPPERREQYDRLASDVQDNPQARLSLQMLAVEGKLTGGPQTMEPGGKPDDLLGSLDKLREGPTSDGIDRQELLGQVIHDVANPGSIAQADQPSCASAVVQTMLARQNPAEYARIVKGLASPEGGVKMANGDTLAREPGTENDDGSRRAIPARLTQAALMEYGNGDFSYDNDRAAHTTTDGQKAGRGLWADGEQRAVEGLFGKGSATTIAAAGSRAAKLIYPVDGKKGAGPTAVPQDQISGHVEAAVQAGHPVSAALEWGRKDEAGKLHESHQVLVTAMDAQTVTFSNPWGEVDAMPRAEFDRRVQSATMLSR
jgi:hypothetical protein